MYELCIHHDFKHDANTVFTLLSDHVAFLSTSHIQCRLSQLGTENQNGLGAVREVRSNMLVFEEEITAFEAPHAYEYRIRALRGPFGWKIPLQHQHGRIELSNAGNHTRATWTTRFHFNIPLIGHLLDRIFAKQIKATFLFFLKRLDQRLIKSQVASS
jgi:hypothetical protein